MKITVGTLPYMALGLLVYLWLGEYQVFAWVDPWLYIYITFWPFILLFNFIIYAIVIGLIIFVVIMIAEWFDNWRKKK